MESTLEEERTLTEEELKICSIQSEWRRTSRAMKTNFPLRYPQNINKFTFFWYDVVEFAPHREITLIGRRCNVVNGEFESCCVTIKKVHKIYYVLPRVVCRDDGSKQVNMEDVCNEVKDYITKVLNVREFRLNIVTKRNIDKTAPFQTEYLKLILKEDNFRIGLAEGNTFLKVFAPKLNCTQTFFLECKIKGPCWLKVEKLVRKQFLFSKCVTEVSCESIDDIEVINDTSLPPFKVLIFNIKTLFNPIKRKNEICMISWIFCDEYDVETQRFNVRDHNCGVHPVFGFPQNFQDYLKTFSDTKVFLTYTEKELLTLFLSAVEIYEVDMIVSYDLTGKDLDLLFDNIEFYKLKCTYMSYRKMKKQLNSTYKLDLFCGKLLFNLRLLSENLVRSSSYSLNELITDNLKVPYIKLDEYFVRKSFEKSVTLRQLLILIIWETYCIFNLTIKLKIIPFTLELSRICGTHWNLTTNGYISDLCEHLLLHCLQEENYIIPSHLQRESLPLEGEGALSIYLEGGCVLEPKVGLHHDFVVALDFFSLYPSIIREFNFCFSSRNQNDIGVLPKLVERLLAVRKLKKIDDIQQLVIKKIANSLYGYLSYKNSKFYSREISDSIIKSGREIFEKTCDIITKELGYEVIYGDTDSVMFKTKCDDFNDSLILAQNVQKRINLDYKHVQIEISSIFRPFIAFTKKKYAGVDHNVGGCKHVFKGLEMVRRDYPKIVANLQEEITKELLTIDFDKNKIFDLLKEFEKKLFEGEHNVELFGITKKLTVDPKRHTEQQQPHVVVALSDFCANRNYTKNDYVTYIFCKENRNRTVCHLDEIKHDDSIELDTEFYMQCQVFPVILRVLHCFEFAENEIRDCLKLPLKKPSIRRTQKNTFYEIICIFCNREYKSKLNDLDFLKGCQSCKITPKNLSNYLSLLIRALLIKHLEENQNRICTKCGNIFKHVSTDHFYNKICCKCTEKLTKQGFRVIEKILCAIQVTLDKNDLPELSDIVKTTLEKLQFEEKVPRVSIFFPSEYFLRKHYKITCVFCNKDYNVKTATLDFLKPCSDCSDKSYKNQENYFQILLRNLVVQSYSFKKRCDNSLCGFTTNSLGLRETRCCENCNVGDLWLERRENESFETMRCILYVLEKNKIGNLSEMVKDVLRRFEYNYVNFNQIFG